MTVEDLEEYSESIILARVRHPLRFDVGDLRPSRTFTAKPDHGFYRFLCSFELALHSAIPQIANPSLEAEGQSLFAGEVPEGNPLHPSTDEEMGSGPQVRLLSPGSQTH